MAYDLKNEIDKVLKFKQDWGIADNVTYSVNGKNAKDHIKNEAQKVYDRMKANGYGTVANNLQSKDYAGAKKYADSYYIKTGRSAFRPYFYQKGKEWGVSQADIDKLISYDNDTGEITFAGKNVGKPDGVVDGVSYMTPERMDEIWKGYATDSGISRSPETLAGVNTEEVRNKINDLYGFTKEGWDTMRGKYEKLENYNYDHNPYESEIGKSIMEDYKLRGDVAADGAIADGAGSNGGNIDSFAAANAKRQQLAFTNAGKQAVLADYNSRIANARGILSDLGVQLQGAKDDMYRVTALQQGEAQRLAENAELGKSNAQQIENDKHDNWMKEAEVTGYVPVGMANKYNPYLSENGILKDASIDYNARITALEKALKTETNADQRAAIEQNIRWLNDARAAKVMLPEYSKFASDRPVIYSGAQETANVKLTKAQMQNALDIANAGNATTMAVANTEAASNKYAVDAQVGMEKYKTDAELLYGKAEGGLTAEDAENALKNGEINDTILALYNSKWGTSYTADNPPPIYGASRGKDWEPPEPTENDDGDVLLLSVPEDYKDMLSTIETSPTGKTHQTYGTGNGTVDLYGARLLEGFFGSDGEKVGSVDDFIKYAVKHSAKYKVDKTQLENVCRYLGFDSEQVKNYVTDKVENVSKNWEDGVQWKVAEDTEN